MKKVASKRIKGDVIHMATLRKYKTQASYAARPRIDWNGKRLP